MALRTHTFASPNGLPLPLKIQALPFPVKTHVPLKPKTQIPCTLKPNNSNSTNDSSDLSSDLASKVAKLSTQLAQREEALKKSKELLFTELCNHLDEEVEQVKVKWWEMSQEEKWVLIKGFVDVWGGKFQPLSVRSTLELIEEYLHEEKQATLDDGHDDDDDSASSSSFVMFDGLKRLMGFSS